VVALRRLRPSGQDVTLIRVASNSQLASLTLRFPPDQRSGP